MKEQGEEAREKDKHSGRKIKLMMVINDECFNAQEDCNTLEFSHTYSLFLARLPDD